MTICFGFTLQPNISPEENQIFFNSQTEEHHIAPTTAGHQPINGPRHHEIDKPNDIFVFEVISAGNTKNTMCVVQTKTKKTKSVGRSL